MGPRGVQSLLYEMHTIRFNILQLQYIEAVFEVVLGCKDGTNESQQTLYAYYPTDVQGFGDFSDPQCYAGFVPSEHYLADNGHPVPLAEFMHRCEIHSVDAKSWLMMF